MTSKMYDSDIFQVLSKSSSISVADLNGKITYVNDKFCQLAKYSREELLGQNHSLLNSGHHSKEYFQALWDTILSGSAWKGVLRNKAKDGSIYWVDTTIVPFYEEDGKVQRFISVRHPVTEIKILQQQLLFYINLSGKYMDVSKNKAKTLAEVSHDVRNVLYQINLTVDLLVNLQLSKDRKDGLISNIKATIDNATELLGRVLEHSKLESNKITLDYTSYSLNKIIEDLYQLFLAGAQLKNINLKMKKDNNLPHTVMCDPYRIMQIMQNILSNAIKYTDSGDVEIGVKLLSREQDKVRINIYVNDTGRGMSIDEQRTIFQEYCQVKSSDCKEGAGLGLVICQKLATLMDGEIKVESSLGVGSVFSLELELNIG